ncbi:hypothetical protein HPB49_005084 [Dermacentor silvarum]|uniref:Uncharacterized protein n=1 Tax=Dermacentor silvarum TaxID=543639 RepID=A0ACB8C7F3_DERSI|nr:hypothetical protein HPB49_005084 [Dermacentor silvarum]
MGEAVNPSGPERFLLPPYSVYDKGPGNSIILSGTFLRLMDYMQEIYGFNVTYQLIENATSVGVKYGEDYYSWSGALGKLNARETDMVAFMDITEERVHSFSMTDNIISHPVAMLMQTPKILSRKLLFVQPFTTQVWALVLISIPVVSVALWLVYNWSPEEAPRRRKGRGLSQLHNCAWYTYGALLQQVSSYDRHTQHATRAAGAVHLPVGTSSRLVVGTWWIYVVIVMAYYSSNLIAFLTVPEPQWLVPSFRDAVRREDIHIYIPYGTGLYQEILKSSSEDFVKLRQRLNKAGATAVNDIRLAIDAVAAGKAILLGDKLLLEALAITDYRNQRRRSCRVAVLSDEIMRISIVDSSVMNRLKSLIPPSVHNRVARLKYTARLGVSAARSFFKLRSSGNLRFLLMNHHEKPHACTRDYNEDSRGLSKPIGLTELESAFLLLLLGTAISSLLLPVEFVARWARARRRARMLTPLGPASQHENTWWTPDNHTTRPIISLRHGWKRAEEAVWTTVGPGGHVISDCYPAFGQFGRRPLFVKQASPFPFYQPCWGGTAAAEEPAQGRRRGHVVMVGNWP